MLGRRHLRLARLELAVVVSLGGSGSEDVWGLSSVCGPLTVGKLRGASVPPFLLSKNDLLRLFAPTSYL